MELQYLQLCQRYTSLQVLFKIFAQICSVVISKEIFEILQTSVSQKPFQQQLLTVLRSSKHSFFLKLQCIYRTGGYGLRKPQMPSVSNGNLIALRNGNIQQNLTKQFTLHSVEAYSEPFPTSQQGSYLIGGNYFHKKLHLRCFKRFRISCCLVNHKNRQTA